MRVTRATVALGLSTPLVVLSCGGPERGDALSTTRGGDGARADAGTGTESMPASSRDAAANDTPRESEPDDPGVPLASDSTADASVPSAPSMSEEDGAGGAGAQAGDPPGSGGNASTGVELGTGGNMASGGAPAAGGAPDPGGNPATGGAGGLATGDGTGGTGGNPAAGGTGAVPEPVPEVVCDEDPAPGWGICSEVIVPDAVAADVAVGEWDETPGLDLVVANSGDLVFFSNDGAGNFGAATPTLALPETALHPAGAIAVSVGQLNDDTLLDVVVGIPRKTKPFIAFGTGGGAVGPPLEPPFAEGSPDNFFVADVFGSGPSDDILVVSETDLMLIVTSGESDEAYLAASNEFYGQSSRDGALATLGSAQYVVHSMETGIQRSAVQNTSASSTLEVVPGTPTAVGGRPLQLDVGDFNEDGFDDVVVTLEGSGELDVLFGDGIGAGDFAEVAAGERFMALSVGDVPNDGAPADVKTGDFNADGHTDLAVTVPSLSAVAIFSGDGSGGFSEPLMVSTGRNSNPTRLAVGDLNSDGADDLVSVETTNGKLIVVLSAR